MGAILTIRELFLWLYVIASSYGYLGAFVMSFLACLILFMPLPYLIIVFALSAPSLGLNPVVLALVSALGATLGKVVVYYIGFGGRKLLSEERRRSLEFAKLILNKYGPIAVFFFALTPLPDDILYIPLGIIGYSILSFFTWCMIGKFLMTLLVTLTGYYSIAWVSDLIVQRPPHGTTMLIAAMLITVVFIIVSIYITIKIDWEKVFIKYMGKKIKFLNDTPKLKKTEK